VIIAIKIEHTAVGCLQLGNTLVFLFDLIGRNSEVQTALYEEVRSLAPPGCDLTVEDLRTAKYLRACISEAFRYVRMLLCTDTCTCKLYQNNK